MRTRFLPASALPLFCLVTSWFLLVGCKPSAPSAADQGQPRSEDAAQPATDAQHRPENDDLARFLRGKLPAYLKLAELKSDAPAPLPGNAWLYNVRVVFAPAEDMLGKPDPEEATAFQAALTELNTLAAWSQAYARSPYAARYPGFAVEPPTPAQPKFLQLVHAKDQPYPALYGKISAQWQVDHWAYRVEDLQTPADAAMGALRSEYTVPILIQGSPEAERFTAQVKAGLDAARPRKAALDAAYHADLVKAIRPGVTYKGTLTHGKKVLPAEARFLAAAPGDEPGAVRMEFRLGPPEYVYRCTVRLADSPPVLPSATADKIDRQFELTGEVPKPAPKADLALGYLGVTDPKHNSIYSPSGDFRSATMSGGSDDKFWLRVQDHRLEGNMTLYSFDPPYFFSGQEAP